MEIAVFSAKPYDRAYLDRANQARGHELYYLEPRLDVNTAQLAVGCPAVSIFVNDTATRPVLERLAAGGSRMLALRSAGFNHVDLAAATGAQRRARRHAGFHETRWSF